MRYFIGFLRFWWDFVIGDDWRIAAGVAASLAAGALLVSRTTLSDTTISLVAVAGIFATVLGAVVVRARRGSA